MPRRFRLLHAIHDFLPRHQAGSEIYAAALCQELQRRGHHLTVLAASFDASRRHGEVIWRVHDGLPVVEVVNNWAFDSFEETYRASNLQPVFDHVLRATQPDVLHVHNLLNLSFDLPQQARAHGARLVGTLHDYTLVCPSGGQRIHRAEQHVCHTIEADRCARCFRDSPFFSQMVYGRVASSTPGAAKLARVAASIRQRWPQLGPLIARAATATSADGPTARQMATRLNRAREVASSFDLLIAPSPSLASEYRALGFPSGRIRVRDYGFQPAPSQATRSSRNGALRVGFVGTLTWHKGVHVLVDAVRQVAPGLITLRIFGDTNTFPDYAAQLRSAAASLPITFAGRFERDAVETVYGEMDVLVIPSIWLENSPLVIHEAFMAGVPVVGARIGGIADLVKDGVNGLLYAHDSSKDLAQALTTLATDRVLLDRLRRHRTAVPSIADDAQAWETEYERLAGASA
jgi:glycosyltransferase involved in cell wall biosynthesis